MLEHIILGFLMHGEMSGYDIKQNMTYSTANFYDASFGSIYPMLKKMEERSLITAKEIVDGGKYRKVYSINENGIKEFTGWLEKPIELTRTKHEHLVKVFFYGFLSKDKIVKQISEFLQDVDKTLEGLNKIEPLVENHADFYQKATLHFGKEYYRFLADWCKNFLIEIEGEK